MGSRTPFEVRLEVLCLARDILSEQTNAKRQTNTARRNYTVCGGKVVEKEDLKRPAKLFDPCTFTTEDVLAEAMKLHAFVNGDTGPKKEPASRLPTG